MISARALNGSFASHQKTHHASKEGYALYKSPRKYKAQKQQAQRARSVSPKLLDDNSICVVRCRSIKDADAKKACLRQCKKQYCTAFCEMQHKTGDSPRKLIECIKRCRK